MLWFSNAYDCLNLGIFKVISSMISLNIMPDFDTLTDYVFPHINIVDPQDLIKKFSLNGVTSLACVTPILYRLIKDGDTRNAADICTFTDLFESLSCLKVYRDNSYKLK